MDPYKGVIRWSIHRARSHFASVLATVIGIPVVSAVVAAFVVLPPKPTRADRIENALIVLGGGIAFIALGAALYAFLRAPYEQRAVLRSRLSAQKAELSELETSIHETLTLSELRITRSVPDLARPHEYNHLQFAMVFRNDAAVPIKYSLRQATIELAGSTIQPDLAHDRYRIGAGQSNQYIIYYDINPVQKGRAVGILDYRLWYGSTSNPDLYEQHYRFQFTNTPDFDPKTTSSSYIQLPGGTDEPRLTAIPPSSR